MNGMRLISFPQEVKYGHRDINGQMKKAAPNGEACPKGNAGAAHPFNTPF